jgi:hypothetical protein
MLYFLGEDDSSFLKNAKYRIFHINKIEEYPFNESSCLVEKMFHFDLVKNLNNPKILSLLDKNGKLFFVIFADEGFYRDTTDFSYKCDYVKFDIERRLRKEKMQNIDEISNN